VDLARLAWRQYESVVKDALAHCDPLRKTYVELVDLFNNELAGQWEWRAAAIQAANPHASRLPLAAELEAVEVSPEASQKALAARRHAWLLRMGHIQLPDHIEADIADFVYADFIPEENGE
jgi:hypothetical protein